MTDTYTVVSAPNASGSGTNTIIVGSGVEGASVIDPVVGDPAHLETIIRAAECRGGIRRILITRGHADYMNEAQALCQKLGVHVFARSYKSVPFANYEMPDGMQIPAGTETLRTIYTPGQSDDHLCFFLEHSRVLFTGDLLAESDPLAVPPEGNLLDYLQSLRRLQQLDIQEIVPAHGPVIREPQARLAKFIAQCLKEENLP